MAPKGTELDPATLVSTEITVTRPADAGSEQPPPDPAALVAQMVDLSPWPDPALLETIVQAGEAVVGPLTAILRTYPRGWPAEAPLYVAIGLLSVLRSPRAIPDLIEIVKRYEDDSGESAAIALGQFGLAAFEPLMETLQDPSIRGYRRSHAIDAAKAAAGNAPGLNARLAESLRFFLADAIERGREEIRQWKLRRDLGESRSGPDEKAIAADEAVTMPDGSGAPIADGAPTGDESVPELSIYEEIALLVSDLADLADPAARRLIKTAFEEELIDKSLVDQASVEDSYRKGGEPVRRGQKWLDVYRAQYQEHLDSLNRPPIPARIRMQLPQKTQSEPEVPAPPPMPETIRNVGPKIGRNDPCWCGSGKKYKKCHLGK